MIIIDRFFWANMLTAVAALSIGYAQRGLGLCSLGVILIGIVWLSMQQKKAWGSEGLIFFVLVVSSGAGIFLGLPGWLMLLAIIAGLGAWDLSHFLMRLNAAQQVEYASGLGREHLLRLGMVELVGFLVGLAGLTFHPQVSFWWEGLLVLIVIVSFSFLLSKIRKETD